MAGPDAAALQGVRPPEAALRTYRFDAEGCGFPPPRVTLLPTVRVAAEGAGSGNGVIAAAVLPAPKGRYLDYSRGRYALRAAFVAAGLAPGTTLLAPSYHCRTMIDPAIRVGAAVSIYGLDAALRPDLDAVERAFRLAVQPVRALLATHYFGRVLDLSLLRAWCNRRDVVMIEDASHALLTADAAAPGVGSVGAMTVASPYKFFPGDDGGLLFISPSFRAEIGSRHDRDLGDEIKALFHLWAGARRPRPRPTTPAIEAEVLAVQRQPVALPADRSEPWTDPSPYYAPPLEDCRSLRVSRWAQRLQHPQRVAAIRRANYARWHAATSAMEFARPLFESLPDDCIPYMFPLLIDRPAPHFGWLKRLGVPVWRWDEMAISDCPVASDYRLRLLHLPCHQSLSAEDMRWLTETVRRVLADPGAAAR